MRQFHELFAGRDDVHGTYRLNGRLKDTSKGPKAEGKATTVTEPVTEHTFQAHLDGERSLGIVPIRTDGTVSWFAIDVDIYETDGQDLHVSLASKINNHDLPLVIFKSKSGGAHLFCFLREPVKATVALQHAYRYLKHLGLPPTTEVFPKQKELGDTTKQKGSWINLPYFGDTRPCMGHDGKTELSLEEFLKYAHDMEVDVYDLGARGEDEPEKVVDTGEERPPCIVAFCDGGVEEGGRDNAVLQFAIFAKKAEGDGNWQDEVFDFNARSVHPSLSARDVTRIIGQVERNDYQYKCNDAPMTGVCDSKTCASRKFGVGDGSATTVGNVYGIDGVVKVMIEPPLYLVTINGHEVRMDGGAILNQNAFRRAVMDQAHMFPQHRSKKDWEMQGAYIMEIAEVLDVSPAASALGMVQQALTDWIGNTVRFDMKHIARAPVYIGDKSGGEVHFSFSQFVQFYERSYGTVKKLDSQQIIVYLDRLGVDVTKEDASDWIYPVSSPWFELQEEGTSI